MIRFRSFLEHDLMLRERHERSPCCNAQPFGERESNSKPCKTSRSDDKPNARDFTGGTSQLVQQIRGFQGQTSIVDATFTFGCIRVKLAEHRTCFIGKADGKMGSGSIEEKQHGLEKMTNDEVPCFYFIIAHSTFILVHLISRSVSETTSISKVIAPVGISAEIRSGHSMIVAACFG